MKTSIKITESAAVGHNMDHKRTAQTQATAAAKAIEDGIASNPHIAKSGRRRWVDTGRLKTSIETQVVGQTVTVVAPPGYLEDESMAEKLVEDVPVIANPFMDRDVERAFEKSVDEAIGFEKGRASWRLR